MALLENQGCSFIVRVWCESGDASSSTPEWRGSIEHVPNGRRAFFRELPAILDFMKPFLEELGIDPAQRFWERMTPALEVEPVDGAENAPVRGANKSSS